tara:strand:- start:8259 stop:9674 length:1416 start_codon:yes stop_codon:yes gene_type:complete
MGYLNNRLDNYKLSNELKIQNISLKNFNVLMYGLIFLLFLTIVLTFVNTHYDFRSHLCKHSNVKKCVAADKVCAHSGAVTSSQSSSAEFLTNQNLVINLNLKNVKSQRLIVKYTDPQNSTSGPCSFFMDFDYTNPVPTTGTCYEPDLLGLGPSAGYHINDHGVSFYLYPFARSTDNITGTSVSQIEYIISQGMLNSPKVIYLDEPFENPKSVSSSNQPTGVVYLKGDSNVFQLGGFIKEKYGGFNNAQYNVKSNKTGNKSLFSNFGKDTNIPMEKIVSSDGNINVTEIIKTNNYKSSQSCKDGVSSGCACVDPVIVTLPDCNKYYYNTVDNIYKLKPTSKGVDNLPETVRFCTYFPSSSVTDGTNSNSIQLNQPPSYGGVIKRGVLLGGYYYDGYKPGSGEGPGKEGNRYGVSNVFCSNTTTLKGYHPKNNQLYTTDTRDTDYSDLSTAYGSCQPNAQLLSGGVVNLGHPN